MAPSRAPLLVNRICLSSRPASYPFPCTRLLHLNRRKFPIQDSPCSHNTTSFSRKKTCQLRLSLRRYSTSGRLEPPDHLDDREQKIFQQLRDALDPVSLQVQDVSGGCGTMYAISITAEKFRGLPVIKQHRLVNEVLGEQIKSWHGIQLKTKVP